MEFVVILISESISFGKKSEVIPVMPKNTVLEIISIFVFLFLLN